MSVQPLSVLVVGASGSVGRLVVAEALRQGHAVRALLRDPASAPLPGGAQLVRGDLTQPHTLLAALDGIDALVFTHGSHGDRPDGYEQVDYGGVRAILQALPPRRVRIALMTAIGVTHRDGAYNRATGAPDWKRRSERLLRASGQPYTIVRPGWFDYNAPDQQRLVLLQGDRRHAGSPADGVVARQQIAEVLVYSLSDPAASGKTFELVALTGAAQADLGPLFAALDPDTPGALDARHDLANMPLADEPHRVQDDYRRLEAPDGEAL